MRYLSPIASRYGAIVIQFLIVIIVARNLDLHEAGLYFVAFGTVATTFTLAGLGMPDGMVKVVANAIATKNCNSVRPSISRAAAITIASSAAVGLVAALFAMAIGFDASFVTAVACWWLLYCLVFFLSQILVSLHRPASGTFFAYTAINIAYVFTLVPYLALTQSPTAVGAIWAGVAGSFIAAVAACIWALKSLSAFSRSDSDTAEEGMFRLGASLAASRFLQASLAWIPVWTTAYFLGAEQAAVYSAAGRLMVAVTAVVASLRFAVRPEIIRSAANNDWRSIERLGRVISLGSTALAVLALLAVAILGNFIIPIVFGPDYVRAVPILLILLIGAVGEGIGGPVDEVLKMTGHQTFVLLTLVVAACCTLLLSAVLSGGGAIVVAAAPAFTFCGMYMCQIIYLYRQTGVLIAPLKPRT